MAMEAGSQTGSLINHLMSGAQAPTPKVGMGATVLHYTDRTAGTIIEVFDDYFVVQADHATRLDGNAMSDSQEYEYTPNPDGIKYTFRKVTRGKAKGDWREGGSKDGNGVLIGTRDQYFDFSF